MNIAVILSSVDQITPSLPRSSHYLWEFRCDIEPYFLDYLDHHSPEVRWIATLRSQEEGGRFQGNRDKLLTRMMALQPTYLDLEIETDLEFVQRVKQFTTTTPILSKHDYSQPMFEAAEQFVSQMTAYEGRNDVVIKFVGNPQDSYDMLKSLDLLTGKYPRHVLLGIGENGIISRTLADDFKQEFVFGALQSGIIPSYQELTPLVDPGAHLTGLLGKSLGHSLSPVLHRLFREAMDLPGYYHLLEVENTSNVEEFVQLLRTTAMRGINITYPYKPTVVHLGVAEEMVTESGVANTLLFDAYDGELYTYNTDISGFFKFFSGITSQFADKLHKILVFGAGGASRAICFALKDMEADLVVVNRSKERFADWPSVLVDRCEFYTLEDYAIQQADVYINATTLGYVDEDPSEILPVPPKCRLVIDLNYDPDDTVLVKKSRAQKIEAYDGKGMLFHQAADAFELWSGVEVDRDHLFDRFRRILNDTN